MDTVNIICDELGVCRQEALYYLEGFQWELDLAMKACRNKSLPSLTVKSLLRVSANEKSESAPSTNSHLVLNRNRVMPDRQSPLRIMPEKQPSQSRDELIAAFCSVALGTYPEDAAAFLDRCNWDVNTAVGMFMDERRPTPGNSNSQRSAAGRSSGDYLPLSAEKYLKDSSKDVRPTIDWASLQNYAEGSSEDESSAAVAMDVMKNRGLPSLSQFHAPVVIRKQDYLKEGKIGSSSISMDVDPTEREKPLKEAGGEHILVDIPVMASSQVNIQNSQIREETLSRPMDTWVDQICNENKVSREEALFYLEGFKWNFGVAMVACRSKTLPPVKQASSQGKSAEAWPSLPERPSQLNDKLISSFCDAAFGATREDAKDYLTFCNWDVNQAVGLFIDRFSNEEISTALTTSLIESKDMPRLSNGLPSKSQFEGEVGSSSSLTYPEPTETERSFIEASGENVPVAIPGMTSSQVEGEAVETSPVLDRIIVGPRATADNITITIVLADGGSGVSVVIPFRSDQTVRDIRDAIDEQKPDNDRDYYLQSMAGVEYKDMNITVYRIKNGGSTTLLQIFPDP